MTFAVSDLMRPADRTSRILRSAQALSSVGDGMFYTCSVLAFTRLLGVSTTSVGLLLSVAWAVAIVTSPILGAMADR